jgi:two-component system nitrate/nitrite sensor histidine kinase NarX
LLTGPFASAHELLCLSVRRGEREFGVLNIFFSERPDLDERTRAFLRALIEEMALGLDSVRLRRNELYALQQMQTIRQKTDLQVLLDSLLGNIQSSLEGDVALLVVPSSKRFRNEVDLVKGDLSSNARPFIDGILQGVMGSTEPVLLGDVSGNPESEPGMRSLMAVPLLSSDRDVIGAILVGSRRPRSYSQRQLALLQTVAGQIALVVQNTSLMAELEYKTMIQERTRLAREIHDGLAQTLGFLKLQVAQMRNHYANGDTERLRQNMDLIYDALSEAYQDARQSIDGLRISPEGDDLSGWLDQAVREFEELSGLRVTTRLNVSVQLQPEVHAQLVRIVQEALSNVRKHARAQRVWIDCHEIDGDMVLEVRDDGVGFLPEDVSKSSRHGLRGMRERSDLLGADFQVVSRPREGTTIRVRLPFKDMEKFLP